ncbi:MAG: 2-oxoglutarate oxidoreductase, partial [Clostridia bacterium]|nr:2-oxoglutarate oxidoreductase [Clostridia bacterium]
PFGRKPELHGYPVRVSEMLSTLEGAVYVERVAVNNVQNIKKAKAAIKKAFQVQMAGLGFSIVEVLSICPTNWGMTPANALKWLEENMMEHYPLGNFKGKDLEV